MGGHHIGGVFLQSEHGDRSTIPGEQIKEYSIFISPRKYPDSASEGYYFMNSWSMHHVVTDLIIE
jgi:hypothetical protein